MDTKRKIKHKRRTYHETAIQVGETIHEMPGRKR